MVFRGPFAHGLCVAAGLCRSLMVIGVSQRVDVCRNRGETRDAVDQRLMRFLSEAGFSPVPVPNSLCHAKESETFDALKSWLSEVSPRAFVLSGGNDIGQNASRDMTERSMLEHAKNNFLPVLGICRGMQMMAAYAGTSLCKVEGHVGVRHNVNGSIEREVNSYHNFAISECPQGFAVLGRSEDGIIEAMRHLTLPWEAWMWHPEREPEIHISDKARIRTLFS